MMDVRTPVVRCARQHITAGSNSHITFQLCKPGTGLQPERKGMLRSDEVSVLLV
jgi:hypothetical protein